MQGGEGVNGGYESHLREQRRHGHLKVECIVYSIKYIVYIKASSSYLPEQWRGGNLLIRQMPAAERLLRRDADHVESLTACEGSIIVV